MRRLLKYMVALTVIGIGTNGVAYPQTIMAGVSGAYGTALNRLGPALHAGICFSDRYCIDGNVSFLGGKTTTNTVFNVRTEWLSYNLTGRYLYPIAKASYIYPLIGVNYTAVHIQSTSTTIFKSSRTATRDHSLLGINLGAGYRYHGGRLAPFAEGKYVFLHPDFRQAVFRAGVVFHFGLPKKTG